MTARAAQCGCGVHGFAMNPYVSLHISTAPYYREARVTFARRQTACRMRHCFARRIEECHGRRKLSCTPTRWAERQRIVGVGQIVSQLQTRQRRVMGSAIGKHCSSSSCSLAMWALSLGGQRGIFSFRGKRISPLSASPARCREQAFAPWQKQSLLLYYKRLRLDTITGNNVAVW